MQRTHETSSSLASTVLLHLAVLGSCLLLAQCFGPRRRGPAPQPGIEGWPLAGGLLPQTDDDESTTYELLAPGSGEFHVRYEVSATSPGATAYYNILRKDSEVRDMRAIDLYSGEELPVAIVEGTEARENGHPTARYDVEYLEIELARPVPEGGQARLAIEKVYGDPRGYFLEDGFEDGRIVFARVMNIRRNAVVLPPDYELIHCNHPTRVLSESDGRLRVSFDKTGQSPVFLVIKARPLPGSEYAPAIEGSEDGETEPTREGLARNASAETLPGEATPADLRTPASDRELLIDLMDPRRNTFLALHDFTEVEAGRSSREVAKAPPGTIVRTRARLLDTGRPLETTVERIERATDEAVDVVRVDFPAIEPGCTARVRVEEIRLDRSSYRIEDGELIWAAHADGALRNLLLPAGWYVTANSIPAVVAELPDGRIRLDYAALSAESLEVTVRARQRDAE